MCDLDSIPSIFELAGYQRWIARPKEEVIVVVKTPIRTQIKPGRIYKAPANVLALVAKLKVMRR